MRSALLAAAAAISALGHQFSVGAEAMTSFGASADLPPQLLSMIGPQRGHTQGSHRDTDHERHRNRLARAARRTERLHRHTATGRRLLARASA